MDNNIKSIIDKIWLVFHSGGVANPLTCIEQITYLLFIKGLDDIELKNERDDVLLGIKSKRIFDEQHQDCRWSIFKDYEASRMFKVMQEKVFPFIKSLGSDKDSSYAKYMEDAMFLVPTPIVLQKVVTSIDKIDMSGRDTKGDLYEYLLSKLSTAGTNGQFRTPRHIIKMMVELMKPNSKDVIVDPACGSAGFLVEAGEYLRNNEENLFNHEESLQHFNNTMFYGFDMDRTMLRISAMNLIQHGIENPNIEYKDSLSEDNSDESKYTLILANPPFKGSINSDITSKKLLDMTNKTKKTELLFLALFLKILKIGGRCASIVPDGVLFGSSNAHKAIRKELIENHKLEAVISMPSGVFKPYAGVSTAILIFTKTNAGGTDKVWFYDMTADGYSLDDKRQPVNENDIPDIIERYDNRFSEEEQNRLKTEKSFFVTKEEIVNNGYDLSINKYKEIIVEEKEYEDPKIILKRLREKEKEFLKCLDELEEML
ncbi:MAG: SAM-dependent DNA methyltransferase [Clostridia bacterium]|jgi:type I restriction enzyme M protein|nr:SAM-dependent DNA methyltransferase [Clostridia bacterium]